MVGCGCLTTSDTNNIQRSFKRTTAEHKVKRVYHIHTAGQLLLEVSGRVWLFAFQRLQSAWPRSELNWLLCVGRECPKLSLVFFCIAAVHWSFMKLVAACSLQETQSSVFCCGDWRGHSLDVSGVWRLVLCQLHFVHFVISTAFHVAVCVSTCCSTCQSSENPTQMHTLVWQSFKYFTLQLNLLNLQSKLKKMWNIIPTLLH